MSEITKNLRAQDIGMMFGRQTASSAKSAYGDIINGAEVEADLMDVMSMYWRHDKLLVAAMFPHLNPVLVKDGWDDGFLDYVFPLRHYA